MNTIVYPHNRLPIPARLQRMQSFRALLERIRDRLVGAIKRTENARRAGPIRRPRYRSFVEQNLTEPSLGPEIRRCLR